MAKNKSYLLLNLRTQVVTHRGSGFWDQVTVPKRFPVAETAILLCDLWDGHWCSGAARRAAPLAEKANGVIAAARRDGVQIIHSPSGTMRHYARRPQRRKIVEAPRAETPEPIDLPIPPPLPIDDSDGGCDTGETDPTAVWSGQHPAIEIIEDDVISDDGPEIFGFMRASGIFNLVVMGVHANMGVLDRSSGIKQMTAWGVRGVLARDLTDANYNPERAPYVSHDRGTELVVEHIERHWCPTVLSEDLLKAYPG